MSHGKLRVKKNISPGINGPRNDYVRTRLSKNPHVTDISACMHQTVRCVTAHVASSYYE